MLSLCKMSDWKVQCEKILDALEEISKAALNYSLRVKAICKPGCGACCSKPDPIWASVGEMLPMANHLIENGEDSLTLQERLENTNAKTCVMFNPESNNPMRGRCAAYSFRPAVCRAFGSSYRADKQGEPQFLGCKFIRNENPLLDQLSKASTLLDANVTNMKQKVLNSIEDSWLREEYPINDALKEALLFLRWQSQLDNLRQSLPHVDVSLISEPHPNDLGCDQ